MGKFKDMDLNIKEIIQDEYDACGGLISDNGITWSGDCPEQVVGNISFGPAPTNDYPPLGTFGETFTFQNPEVFLDSLSKEIFENNKAKGFWDECLVKYDGCPNGDFPGFQDFVPSFRNTGELIALMHSELSEALEAHRKDKQDDHLPQYKGTYVELADCLIRILDYCGAHDVPIGEIVRAKIEYNKSRPYKHGKLF